MAFSVDTDYEEDLKLHRKNPEMFAAPHKEHNCEKQFDILCAALQSLPWLFRYVRSVTSAQTLIRLHMNSEEESASDVSLNNFLQS